MYTSLQINNRKVREFSLIWFGQFLSMIGSGVSFFGLSVWIFLETNNVMYFVFSFACTVFPTIIFKFFAQRFVEYKDRKNIIMAVDGIGAVLKLFLFILVLTSVLNIWFVYAALLLSATLDTFRKSAITSATSSIIPKKLIARSKDMMRFASYAQKIIAPTLAALLFPIIQLEGILLMDCFSFLIAILTLMTVRLPQLSLVQNSTNQQSLTIEDYVYTKTYLKENKECLGLCNILSVLHFQGYLGIVLIGPVLLIHHTESIYGVMQSVCGFSIVASAVVIRMMPELNLKIKTLLGLVILSGIGLIIAGLTFSWTILALAFSVTFFCLPYTSTLLLKQMKNQIDGPREERVDTILSLFLKICSVSGILVSGILAQYVFEPMMQENGFLGQSIIGTLLGVGEGRGMSVMYILSGIVLITVGIVMVFNKTIKSIDESISDDSQDTSLLIQ